MIGYIYKITNLKNNKLYFGSTIKKGNRRWSDHKWAAKTNNGYALHQAMRKYGIENFNFEIIFCTKDIENLEEIEDKFILENNSINGDNGYNMIPAFKSRPYVSSFMKKEWSDPVKRIKRLEIQRNTAISRQISIVAVCIYSGSINYYDSINSAVRNGYSASAITESLKGRTKIGQGYIWFYKDHLTDKELKTKAETILGGFKKDFLIPIKGWNDSGHELYFTNSFELKDKGFEPKAVRRVCRGERKTYKGYYWKFKK